MGLEKALETLNVKVSRYVVYENNLPHIILVGGVEVVVRVTPLEITEAYKDYKKIDIVDSGDEDMLLPFMFTNVRIEESHLEELIRFRSLKTLSKDDASKHEVTKKERLLNKIVYLYDKNPSTNSLALAKQFDIEHFHVIQQIFKLAESNPSILMGVKYSVYKDVTNRGGKVKDVEIVGSNRLIEHSINQSNTNNTQTIYRTFLHITEDVYYKFINNMGTPKSLEMKVYREIKRNEYLKGFQNLREKIYDLNYNKDEIAELIKIRTDTTKQLMNAIYDYVLQYNTNSGSNKQLELEIVKRIIFNLINSKLNINSIDYKNNTLNRSIERPELQKLISEEEIKMTMVIKTIKKMKGTIYDAIESCLDFSKEEVFNRLRDRNVEHLLTHIQ